MTEMILNQVFGGLLLLVMFFYSTLAISAEIVHIYDEKNQLIRSVYSDGKGVDYSYDAAGNLISKKAIAVLLYIPDFEIQGGRMTSDVHSDGDQINKSALPMDGRQ